MSAAYGDFVLALGYDGLASFGDHAQIAGVQVEVEGLGCAGVEVDALEAAQGAERSAGNLGEFEIELGYFIPCFFACVGDCDIEANCVACGD